MAGLQFNKTGTGQKEHTILFACSEAVESNLVKLETSHTTVILPPVASVLWFTSARSSRRSFQTRGRRLTWTDWQT